MSGHLQNRVWRLRLAHLLVPATLLGLLIIAAAVRGPELFSADGLAGGVIVVVPLILATIAITPVALVGGGGVDLSIGPLLGFINVSLVTWLVGHGITSPVAVVSYVIGAGALYQLILGAVIAYVRVAPIIVTLSGFLVLQGINLEILDRLSGSAPPWMASWGAGTTVFSPVLGVLAAGISVWVLASRTGFLSTLRLVGADERMAFASGVRTDLVRLMAHGLAGIYAGLAALAYTALIGSGDPTQGSTFTLSAVTALVLGGTNLAGGRGGALGSILGAVDMYLISYVLGTFSFGMVSGFVTQMFFGIVLIASLLVRTALPSRAAANS